MTTTDNFPVNITAPAAAKVRELLAAEADDNLSLRMAVRPGGCSGFSYEMFFDTDVAETDVTGVVDDVPVVLDASSAVLLSGATLDYASGLQSGFSFKNPNAQRTCGCGSSFS